MGKQIGIYMTRADEDAFVKEVTAGRGACFALPSLRTDQDLTLFELPLINTKPPKGVLYYIRPMLRDGDLVVKEYPIGARIVNQVRSEIIELHRSMVLDVVCYPGRLWYEARLPDKVKKSSAFLQWADSLFRWLRRQYRLERRGAIDYFAGPDACRAKAAGEVEWF